MLLILRQASKWPQNYLGTTFYSASRSNKRIALIMPTSIFTMNGEVVGKIKLINKEFRISVIIGIGKNKGIFIQLLKLGITISSLPWARSFTIVDFIGFQIPNLHRAIFNGTCNDHFFGQVQLFSDHSTSVTYNWLQKAEKTSFIQVLLKV